jgi:hypothetical protein
LIRFETTTHPIGHAIVHWSFVIHPVRSPTCRVLSDSSRLPDAFVPLGEWMFRTATNSVTTRGRR